MNEMVGKDMIKRFLESTNIHYTSREIARFFSEHNILSDRNSEYDPGSLQKYLKQLADTDQIESREIAGKRDKLFHAKKNPTDPKKQMSIDLYGYWFHHPDKSFSPSEKDLLDQRKRVLGDVYSPETVDVGEQEQNLDESVDKFNNLGLFIGTGICDYLDLAKVAGINPYHKNDMPDDEGPYGVQREKAKEHIDHLKRTLSRLTSFLATNAIVYFSITGKEEDVSIVQSGPISPGSPIGRYSISIPYQEHVFDTEKSGFLLDGQQRLWAIDLINLERVFVKNLEYTPFYTPVTCIVGDIVLPTDLTKESIKDFELELLRTIFIIANNTKNLPPTLMQELASHLQPGLRKQLTAKTAIKSYIEEMAQTLGTARDSPFYRIIDDTTSSYQKHAKTVDFQYMNGQIKKVRCVSRKILVSMIKDMLKGHPFLYDEDSDLYGKGIYNKKKEWLELITDYFTAIKAVFYKEWEDEDSILKHPIFISALGIMISAVLNVEILGKSRGDRIESMIEQLVKWKGDEMNIIDFSSDSQSIHERYHDKPKKAHVRQFSIVLYKSYSEAIKGGTIDQHKLEIAKQDLTRIHQENQGR